VRDLALPPDVTLVSEPDDVVAKVLPPRVVEEEAPAAEEAEAEAGEEGAEAGEGAEAAGEATEAEPA
jgi:hypothetical protein